MTKRVDVEPAGSDGVDLIAVAQQNWNRRGWDATTAMAAATSITRSHQIVLARINQTLAPFGLTFSRYEALVLISFTKNGALPMGKIGERLQVHPTSVTNTVDRLEADGLVTKERHPTDGRTTLATITDAGRAIADAATTEMAGIRFGMGDLDDDACDEITDTLGVLRSSAGDF